MIACHFLRCLLVAGSLLPCAANSQNDSRPIAWSAKVTNPENTVSANVPLNEINTHAFRRFHRLFSPAITNEYWFKSDQGYQVSFILDGCHHQAWFDPHGAYLYSLKFYAGKEIPRGPGDLIRKKYADYRIDVITEITDGEKTFYLVKISNPAFVKTLSISDGRIDVMEDLVNAGA